MLKALKSFLAASIFVTAVNADINEDFDHILTGQVPVSDKAVQDLYNRFLVEGKSLVDLQDSSIDRFNIFLSNVIQIANHNNNKTKTFKRGVNKYTAMTPQEVTKYYNLKDGQNCSATN